MSCFGGTPDTPVVNFCDVVWSLEQEQREAQEHPEPGTPLPLLALEETLPLSRGSCSPDFPERLSLTTQSTGLTFSCKLPVSSLHLSPSLIIIAQTITGHPSAMSGAGRTLGHHVFEATHFTNETPHSQPDSARRSRRSGSEKQDRGWTWEM